MADDEKNSMSSGKTLADQVEHLPIDRITALFNDHDGDGEFTCPARTNPFQVVFPTPSAKTILYSTKPLCVLALEDCETVLATGLIGRYGLPTEDNFSFGYVHCTGDRVVYFLGDADPVDLLIFVLASFAVRREVRWYQRHALVQYWRFVG